MLLGCSSARWPSPKTSSVEPYEDTKESREAMMSVELNLGRLVELVRSLDDIPVLRLDSCWSSTRFPNTRFHRREENDRCRDQPSTTYLLHPCPKNSDRVADEVADSRRSSIAYWFVLHQSRSNPLASLQAKRRSFIEENSSTTTDRSRNTSLIDTLCIFYAWWY